MKKDIKKGILQDTKTLPFYIIGKLNDITCFGVFFFSFMLKQLTPDQYLYKVMKYNHLQIQG